MNMLQHLVSLILHRGHAGKQVKVHPQVSPTVFVHAKHIDLLSKCLLSVCACGLCNTIETCIYFLCSRRSIIGSKNFFFVSHMNEQIVTWMCSGRDITRKHVNGAAYSRRQ